MEEPLTCYKHPKVETRLRCNKCGQPVCAKCVVRTPVGYRCRDCVNAQQRAFYAGFQPGYYLVAGLVALPLSLLAGWLMPRLGWYVIFLGPVVGGGIAEAVRWAIKRKRGEYTWMVVCGSVVVGVLPTLFSSLLALSGFRGGGLGGRAYVLGGTMRLIWAAVYAVTAAAAAYARLRGVKRP